MNEYKLERLSEEMKIDWKGWIGFHENIIFLMKGYMSAIGKLEHYNIRYWKHEPNCHLADWRRFHRCPVQNLTPGYLFLLHWVSARMCPHRSCVRCRPLQPIYRWEKIQTQICPAYSLSCRLPLWPHLVQGPHRHGPLRHQEDQHIQGQVMYRWRSFEPWLDQDQGHSYSWTYDGEFLLPAYWLRQ